LSVENIANVVDKYINKTVIIELKNTKTIRGNLEACDQHMNLTLTNSEEIIDGKAKNLGNIILRGDALVLISLPR